jgi:hypothetical protein
MTANASDRNVTANTPTDLDLPSNSADPSEQSRTTRKELVGYYATARDDLANILLLELADVEHVQCDPSEFDWAAGFALGLFRGNPNDRNLLRAQIAACRAIGVDLEDDLHSALTRDPSLEQRAVLLGDWPEPVQNERGHTYGSKLGDTNMILEMSFRAFTRKRWKDADAGSPVRAQEFVRFALPAMVSLFGQVGLDYYLTFKEVQETLLSTELKEFAEGGAFPNISLPARRMAG